MGLIIPSRRDVVAALQSYVRSYLPEADPSTERRAYIGGQVKSLGSSLHDWYVALKRFGDNEPFPQTASRPFLLNGWWRDITKLNPNAAAPARGTVVLLGTVSGTIVPAGTVLNANGVAYSTDRSAAIVTQSLRAFSLTRSGTTAIFETPEPHHLATGMIVTVSDATETAYNGAHTITVTADNEFTFEVSGSPATPATGSPILSGTWGTVDITATTTGQQTNVDAGGSLSSTVGISGFDGIALVIFGGLGGGTLDETTDSYRGRTIEALGTDFGMFSAAEIKIVAKTVPGVTRVWVREATLDATNGVAEGQVRIAFMRDDDANPFPSAQEVAAVKDVIVSNIMPAHTAEEDVILESPTPLFVDFAISALSPNTASMRRSIRASLEQFFRESVDYATQIEIDDYRCAIKDAYDREGQASVKAFTLTTPTTAIAVGLNEMPRLGTIAFPNDPFVPTVPPIDGIDGGSA